MARNPRLSDIDIASKNEIKNDDIWLLLINRDKGATIEGEKVGDFRRMALGGKLSLTPTLSGALPISEGGKYTAIAIPGLVLVKYVTGAEASVSATITLSPPSDFGFGEIVFQHYIDNQADQTDQVFRQNDIFSMSGGNLVCTLPQLTIKSKIVAECWITLG